jgi:hypothetical protein
MDLNFKRRSRERAIATEVVNELFAELRPAMDAGADAATLIEQHRPLLGHILGTACQRNGLQTEAEVQRVFGYIAPTVSSLSNRYARLARKVKRAEIRFG